MDRGKDKKSLLIGSLVAIVLIMSVGFALFSEALEVNNTATVSGNWAVKFKGTSLTEVSKSPGANITASTISDNKLSAIFSATLNQPGDYAEYSIEVENTGTINAILSDVALEAKDANNTPAIKFSYQVLNAVSLIAAGDMTGSGNYNKSTEIIKAYAPLNKTNGIHKLLVRFDYLADKMAQQNATAGYTLILNYNQTA